MPVRYTATHTAALYVFCHDFAFDIFRFVCFYSFLWRGLAIQTHHTASPSKLPCIYAPAYVYYGMLLYILMEYCTLVTSQPGESLKAPFTSAK